MKSRVFPILLLLLILVSLVNSAEASIGGPGGVSVITDKTGDKITLYIKNTNNKQSRKVRIEAQEYIESEWQTVDLYVLSVKPDKQEKEVYEVTKGKYRFKYSVGSESAYTKVFKH